ncbi:hypothetical protein F9K73_07495 [Brucella intermedia]|uniref:hypothetical protein n=1 Tax=Brucella intermedia TaxID=94625 RepID=UPI00124F4507|nr:hypothetical protein [Brucella intermedia]KAB2722047.1 hypothetical protein F9K73_07495 [Brucella intermedia]
MSAQDSRARRGRPQRPAPQALPDDLYNYGDDLAPSCTPRGRNAWSGTFDVDVEKLPVIDDWPERVPVTEAEVDTFDRYFGDVLDRLFGPLDAEGNEGLNKLTSDVNDKP